MNAPKFAGKYEIRTSIIIDAPKAAVWDLLKDFGNVSDWAPAVNKSHYLNDKTSGVGTGRHCDIKGFGGIQEYITEWQENEGFVYSVTPLGPLAASNSRWWLSPIKDNQTRLEIVLNYNVRFGIFGIILHKLIMRRKLEKSLPETLLATKKQVEKIFKQVPSTPLSTTS